jgi:hypothetical protein
MPSSSTTCCGAVRPNKYRTGPVRAKAYTGNSVLPKPFGGGTGRDAKQRTHSQYRPCCARLLHHDSYCPHGGGLVRPGLSAFWKRYAPALESFGRRLDDPQTPGQDAEIDLGPVRRLPGPERAKMPEAKMELQKEPQRPKTHKPVCGCWRCGWRTVSNAEFMPAKLVISQSELWEPLSPRKP